MPIYTKNATFIGPSRLIKSTKAEHLLYFHILLFAINDFFDYTRQLYCD